MANTKVSNNLKRIFLFYILGILPGSIWSPPVPEAEITEEDKQQARAVWAYVDPDYAGTGLLLFKELFTAHPEYEKFFSRMKAYPDQDIFESPRFKKHMVSALFPAIALMLRNLDYPDKLASQLHEIGVNHKKRNVTRKHLEVLHGIMILTFKKALGNKFTPEMESAWNKILSIAFDKISDTIESI